MNLSQLYYFVVTCESDCNMTKAAKRLTISQSAISYAVRMLEREFHMKLFYRDAQGLKLTEEGNEFYLYACRVVKASRELSDRFLRGRSRGRTELSLGLTPLAHSILQLLLSRLGSAVPVALNNICVFQRDKLLSLLDMGVVDLAILGGSHLDDFEGYGHEVVGCSCAVLYTSSRNPLSRHRSILPEQLSETPLFFYLENVEMLEKAKDIFPQFIPGLRMDNIKGFSTELSSVLAAIKGRDCSTVLGHGAIAPTSEIREVPIDGALPFEIVALWRGDWEPGEPVRTLLDELKAYMKEME